MITEAGAESYRVYIAYVFCYTSFFFFHFGATDYNVQIIEEKCSKERKLHSETLHFHNVFFQTVSCNSMWEINN